MTIWNLFEYLAWALSALIAGWLVYDAVMTSRRYSEEFLTHTLEDFGDSDFSEFHDSSVEEGRS